MSDYLVTGELPACFRGALRLCKEVKSGDHRTAEGELFYIAVVLAGSLSAAESLSISSPSSSVTVAVLQ